MENKDKYINLSGLDSFYQNLQLKQFKTISESLNNLNSRLESIENTIPSQLILKANSQDIPSAINSYSSNTASLFSGTSRSAKSATSASTAASARAAPVAAHQFSAHTNFSTYFSGTSANTAIKAIQDINGKSITETYIPYSSVDLSIGSNNSASYGSFAQGASNSSYGHSLVQGTANYASSCSIAQGSGNSAISYSQAFGNGTIANNSGMSIGTYNETDSAAFVIGNGSDSANRSDAFVIDHNGNVSAAGDIKFNGISLLDLYNSFTAYTASH